MPIPQFRRASARIAAYCLPLLVGCAIAVTAQAQTMYKCQNNGRIEYSDRPCWSGTEVKRMTPSGGLTPEDVERARMRAAAEQVRVAAQEREARQAPRTTAAAAGMGTPPNASSATNPDDGKVPAQRRDNARADKRP